MSTTTKPGNVEPWWACGPIDSTVKQDVPSGQERGNRPYACFATCAATAKYLFMVGFCLGLIPRSRPVSAICTEKEFSRLVDFSRALARL